MISKRKEYNWEKTIVDNFKEKEKLLGKHPSIKDIQKKREYLGEHHRKNIQKKRLGKHPRKKYIKKEKEEIRDNILVKISKRKKYIWKSILAKRYSKEKRAFGRTLRR